MMNILFSLLLTNANADGVLCAAVESIKTALGCQAPVPTPGR